MNRKFKPLVELDLSFYDEGAAVSEETGESAGEGAKRKKEARPSKAKSKNPLATVKYGKQKPAQPEKGKKPAEDKKGDKNDEERKAEFEKLIKGEFKDLFAQRTQQIINDRFKKTKQIEAQLEAQNELLEKLAAKYGVGTSDVDALSKAIDEDNTYYEQEALKAGMTVEQFKDYRKTMAENASLKRAQDQAKNRAQGEQIYAGWLKQAEALKAKFPEFDLEKEINDPKTGERFLGLLKHNIDVENAHFLVHKDEILGGAMQYSAQQAAKRVTDGILAKGRRPRENGANTAAAGQVVKADPSKFTKDDRDEISRRVLRGEKIIL